MNYEVIDEEQKISRLPHCGPYNRADGEHVKTVGSRGKDWKFNLVL